MFMLVSWFGLTFPALNAADWFRRIRLLKRLFVSSHLSEVIYVWCYCWRYCFCSCCGAHAKLFGRGKKPRPRGIQRWGLAACDKTARLGDCRFKTGIESSHVGKP